MAGDVNHPPAAIAGLEMIVLGRSGPALHPRRTFYWGTTVRVVSPVSKGLQETRELCLKYSEKKKKKRKEKSTGNLISTSPTETHRHPY